MPLFNNTKAPVWVPNSIRTTHGWEHPTTGEVLVAFTTGTPVTYSETGAAVIASQFSQKHPQVKTGDFIKLAVFFDKQVVVTGTPRIPLSINGVTRYANYIPTSGKPLSRMLFQYRVVSGDAATPGQVTVGIPAVAATATILASNAGINYTAVTPGTGGNSITVAYVNPLANNAALSVSVTSNAITVNLATGGGGAITSTASLIRAAIIASGPASALVTTSLVGTGATVVTAVSATNLTGGAAGSGSTVIDLNSGTITNYGTKVKAKVNILSSNAGITYTAKNGGTAGNSITVAYVDPSANNAALSVTVSTNAITVHLATGAGGAITSTATSIRAAVLASTAASQLVVPTLIGTGATVVTAVSATNLAGGANSVSGTTSFSSFPPNATALKVN